VTLVDDSTDVLPPIAPIESAGGHDERSTPIGLIVVLVLTLLAFAAAALLIAEGIARADVERSIEADLRAGLSLAETQHIGVTVEGSALLQGGVNRYGKVDVSMPNLPLSRSSADLTADFTGVTRDDDGVWLAERGTGVLSLGAAQATSFYIPDEARGKLRIGFRGAEMTLDATLTSGGRSLPTSVAMTPTFQNGWLSSTLGSITMGGVILTADELRSKVGDETLTSLQSAPLCVAEDVPRAATVRDVTVRDQHLRIEVDVDGALLATPEGRQPGACS
jgi:hypothetical protein